MTEMVNFSIAMLNALVDFLSTPPIFYLFGLVCFCFICKALKILMSR